MEEESIKFSATCESFTISIIMLIEAKKLQSLTIHALDGEVGRVDELLFDDEFWTVRYLIIDTGNWLVNRKVLIAPQSLGEIDWVHLTLSVNLTRAQIENSPGVEMDQPVSRQWERGYFDYYSWPYYWWNSAESAGNDDPAQERKVSEKAHQNDDGHLRSTKEVSGYSLQATDGSLGHIEDFIVRDGTWRICYLGVDTKNWWPGKITLLTPEWISEVDWPGRSVHVSVTRDQVKGAPEWERDKPITPLIEERLYRYYDRQEVALVSVDEKKENQ